MPITDTLENNHFYYSLFLFSVSVYMPCMSCVQICVKACGQIWHHSSSMNYLSLRIGLLLVWSHQDLVTHWPVDSTSPEL